MTRAAKLYAWLDSIFTPSPSDTPSAAPTDDESTQRSGKQSLSPEDRKRIVERHFEVMQDRRIEAELNFRKALELGEKLKKLKEG
ncbi:MAG TPA: hypothetical protein VGC14_24140 [Rhizobium sp.]